MSILSSLPLYALFFVEFLDEVFPFVVAFCRLQCYLFGSPILSSGPCFYRKCIRRMLFSELSSLVFSGWKWWRIHTSDCPGSPGQASLSRTVLRALGSYQIDQDIPGTRLFVSIWRTKGPAGDRKYIALGSPFPRRSNASMLSNLVNVDCRGQ